MQQSKKCKVLVIGHLPPPQEGTAKLTQVIVESGYLREYFQLLFLSLQKRKSPTQRGKFGVVNIAKNIINILNLFYHIIFFQPHLVYGPLSQNKLGFFRDSLFVLAGWLFRKKTCVHFHGGSFSDFYKERGRAVRAYIRFVLRRIDRLILLAAKFHSQFTPFLDARKISVLCNCVPESPLPREGGLNPDRAKEKKTVLFIGYLSKAKGALDLVKAVPSVLAGYMEPVEFILCGEAVDIERNILFIPEPHYGYSKIQELIVENNLSEYVKLHPEVIDEKKREMFKKADLFVLPSYSEGCALVVLEAMLFGLPIITTPVGALEEMFVSGENCFFIEPGDIEGLSEKILFLLDNPNMCKKMGQANNKLVVEKYNSDAFLSSLAQIWNGLLSQGSETNGRQT